MNGYRLDNLFSSQQAALDALDKTARLSPDSIPGADLSRMKDAIRALDLSFPESTCGENDVICLDCEWLIRIRYKRHQATTSLPGSDGWGYYDITEIAITREVVSCGVSRRRDLAAA